MNRKTNKAESRIKNEIFTYPNQKIIRIEKSSRGRRFLQLSYEDIQVAAKNLSGASFKLYIYLAKNNDGFELALSQKEVEHEMGVSRNAYHRSITELTSKGYIIHVGKNIYSFHTNPTAGMSDTGGHSTPLLWADDCAQTGHNTVPILGREREHIENIDNNRDNSIENNVAKDHGENTEDESTAAPEDKSPEEKEVFISGDGKPGRRLRDLTQDQSREIIAKMDSGISYEDIEREYGMREGTVTAKFAHNWGLFVQASLNRRV